MEQSEVFKEIRKRIKPALKEMGFKTRNSHYVRVSKGEIVQCFGFQKFNGDHFTVNFGITPLYTTSSRYFLESRRIGDLIGPGDKWWTYCEKSVDLVSDLILNTLLVVFKQCDSYIGFYEAVEKSIVEVKSVEESKKQWDTRWDNPDMANIIHNCTGHIHELCIRLGKLDKALICINNSIIGHQRVKSETSIRSNHEQLDRLIAEDETIKRKILMNDVDDIINNYKKIEIENIELLEKYLC